MTKNWDAYKSVIVGEYKDNNKALHEVQRIMESKYNFKASIRAYRSRLDKWGVYKYTCRKRKNLTTSNGRIPSREDAANLSPPETPRDSTTLASPSNPISPITPVQGHQFFGPLHCTATPPSGGTSPSSPPVKVESPQPPPYHGSQLLAAPPMRHAMSLPNPSFLDQQFRYHHYPPSPQSQSHFGLHSNYYRQNTHGHIFQGPGHLDLAIAQASSMVGETGYPLQHPHHFPLVPYHDFSMDVNDIKTEGGSATEE